MKIITIQLLLFMSIFIFCCVPKIDGTNENAFNASLEKIKSKLSESENDSLSKCIMAIVNNSEYNLGDIDKIRKNFDGMTANEIFKKGAAILEVERIKESKLQHKLDSLTAIFVADSLAKYKEIGNWRIKYFIDDFQQETKNGYIIINCRGTFSNSATTNSELKTQVVVTDKEELQLFLEEYGSQPVKSSSASYIIKLLRNGEELKTHGRMYSDRIIVNDKKVIDLIRKGGKVKVYLEENSRFGLNSTYLFEFDATNYDGAMKKLKS